MTENTVAVNENLVAEYLCQKSSTLTARSVRCEPLAVQSGRFWPVM